MLCKCCERPLSACYLKSGEKHCSACSRGLSAGSKYSEIVSGMLKRAKDYRTIKRLEVLIAKHQKNELSKMSDSKADRLRRVRENIRPMKPRLCGYGDESKAKWWCGTCNSRLNEKRCLKCELEVINGDW